MENFESRKVSFKAVMYSEHLDKYYVSDACYVDGGETMLEYLFSFEDRNIDAMWDDLFSSEKYISKFENIISEDEMDDYSLLDWVHVGNVQGTFLKDKNGVDIYFDDLTKINDTIYLVVELCGSVAFVCPKTGDFWNYACNLDTNEFGELVGSKYENPELLKDINA